MNKGSIYIIDRNFGCEEIQKDSGSLEFEAGLLKENGYKTLFEKHPDHLSKEYDLIICHTRNQDWNRIFDFYKKTDVPTLLFPGKSDDPLRIDYEKIFEDLVTIDCEGIFITSKITANDFLFIVGKIVNQNFDKNKLGRA